MSKNHIARTNRTQKATMNKAPVNHDQQVNTADEGYKSGLGGQYGVYKYYNEWDDETIHPKPKRCMCIDFQDLKDFNKHSRCAKLAIKGSDFCENHQNCSSYLRNFLSGSEPEYQPELWSNPFVEGSHNCYSYFLNRQVRAIKEKCQEICLTKSKKGCPDNSECSDLKPQPKHYRSLQHTGIDSDSKKIYRCPQMQKSILADNPSILPIPFNKKCPANYYKGAMVVDSGVGYGYKKNDDNSNSSKNNGNTFHFYRQDSNGDWSHKPGISPVHNRDSNDKKIYVPHFANRDYRKDSDDDDALYYNEFCGYYCIPNNQTEHKKMA